MNGLLVLALLLGPVTPAAACETGYIARHDAFASVFANFPDRADTCPPETCAGHFGAICSEYPLGTQLLLVVGFKMRTVVVSDCVAAGDIPWVRSMGRIGDLQKGTWDEMGLPARTVKALICPLQERGKHE